MDVNEYVNIKESHEQDYILLKSNYNRISLFRLLCAIVFITSFFYYIKYNDSVEWVILISLLCFIILMMKHRKLDWDMKLKKALIEINDKELKYIRQEEIPFEDGLEFSNTEHSYAHDLDFFGKKSLFQHLNRTATYIGKVRLSSLLLQLLPNDEILKQQKAIHELKGKIKWRQEVNAISMITNDSKNSYYHLIDWTKILSEFPSKILVFISYFIPFLALSSLLYYALSHEPKAWSVFVIAFLSNLVVLLFQLKNIKLEIFKSDKMHEIV